MPLVVRAATDDDEDLAALAGVDPSRIRYFRGRPALLEAGAETLHALHRMGSAL